MSGSWSLSTTLTCCSARSLLQQQHGTAPDAKTLKAMMEGGAKMQVPGNGYLVLRIYENGVHDDGSGHEFLHLLGRGQNLASWCLTVKCVCQRVVCAPHARSLEWWLSTATPIHPRLGLVILDSLEPPHAGHPGVGIPGTSGAGCLAICQVVRNARHRPGRLLVPPSTPLREQKHPGRPSRLGPGRPPTSRRSNQKPASRWASEPGKLVQTTHWRCLKVKWL